MPSVVYILLVLVLVGLPSIAMSQPSLDEDVNLASRAAEILLLERMARDTDDPLVREAAGRQILRLERDARTHAKSELGRDLFRERTSSAIEPVAGGNGSRNVRMFGGREVRGREAHRLDRERDRDKSRGPGGLRDHPRGGGDRDGGRGDREDRGDSDDGRDDDDGDHGGDSGPDEDDDSSQPDQDEEDDLEPEPDDEDRFEPIERDDDDDR